MGKSSKNVRLLRARTYAALVAATLVSVAVPASVNAAVKRIAMRTVNNSSHGITASYCGNGHVSVGYLFGTRHNPCNVATDALHLGGGGSRSIYISNPFGAIISNSHKTLYFYARNPSIGRPFIEVNGHSYSMVEGQLTTVHVAGATVRLHREGDRDARKQMTIEIISMG